MSARPVTAEPRALFSPDGTQWSDGRPLDWSADEHVTKIVIGQPPTRDATGEGEDKSVSLVQPIPDDLSRRFKKLTHLYLWQIKDLTALPDLPEHLECLDVRGCPDLAALPELPPRLETLVLEQCPKIPAIVPRAFGKLEELSVRGSSGISEDCLHELLRSCPALRTFDASHCTQLTRIPEWAPALVDIQLNACPELGPLPADWPAAVRRVGLRRARRVTQLPNFPGSLDYVDLAYTESLRRLPEQRGRPRTLFLFESRVLVPPASEHGAHADENVAARTEAYFSDVALTGTGEVKRCKLLVLGNGGAGKTCLSLALTGDDPRRASQLGSTHGIQFWDWHFTANIRGSMDSVHLHLWDFGGQEIYHNTHRLFMGKGTVFVVVWKPQQDGQKAPRSSAGYQDEWRPLQYWLDFIHLACPHKPRIAIVCSHHAERSDVLDAQWRDQVRPEFRDECECFYIDSLTCQGELGKLQKWLQDAVGSVVATQGTAVPSYWQVAQEMTENWVQRLHEDDDFASDHNVVAQDHFRNALASKIDETLAGDTSGRYARLADAVHSGKFQLDEERLRRTLEFLTHSGWLYWDPRLFKGRVIIGQKWALKGLYAILQRHDVNGQSSSDVYRQLVRNDGRFTLSQLGEWAWNEAGYTPEEQQVLRSFMERCGLCFRLRPGAEAWADEDVYVSFEHLPLERELQLQNDFDWRTRERDPTAHETLPPMSLLHKQHWQAFLTDAGGHYGKDARYAHDAFYLQNEEGQLLLIRCSLRDTGLGGTIEIQVSGRNAHERLNQVKQHIARFLPGNNDRTPPDPQQSFGRNTNHVEVFISYARNPSEPASDASDAPDYELPVNVIETFLRDKPVTPYRDRSEVGWGDDIVKFMKHGARCPHVIVVHSDRYFRSPNCIFELKCLFQALQAHADRSFVSVVIPVEHVNSPLADAEAVNEYLDAWRTYSGPNPPRLQWDLQELRENAVVTIRDFSREVSNLADVPLRWQDGEQNVLTAIAARLGLSEEDRER